MADEKREADAAAKAQALDQADELESFRNRRRKPKTVTRAPADKMMRPGMTQGYETK